MTRAMRPVGLLIVLACITFDDFKFHAAKVTLFPDITRKSPENLSVGLSKSNNTAQSIVSTGASYCVDGKQLNRQYKEHFGGFREWDQLTHAELYVLFTKNMGPHLAMDEVALSADELYTIVTNKDAHGRKGALVAMVKGTRSEDVIKILKLIHKWQREQVVEMTVDLSPTMMLIAREAFPKAEIVNDRFHVQQLVTEALTAIRLECKREAQDVENATKMLCKEIGVEYKPFVCNNGDTLKQLFARSNRLIMKNRSKWTSTQEQRAELLFRYSPRML